MPFGHGDFNVRPSAEQQKKLATLSIVLGSLYAGAAAMFLFGVFAAASVRRLLTVLSPLTSNFPMSLYRNDWPSSAYSPSCLPWRPPSYLRLVFCER